MDVIRLTTDRENPHEQDHLAIVENVIPWPYDWPPPEWLYVVIPYGEGTRGSVSVYSDADMETLRQGLANLGELMEDHYAVLHYQRGKYSKLDGSTAIMARGAEFLFRGVKPWTPTQKENADV